MNSKLRVKIGTIEFEYEGETDFLRNDLLPLINQIISSTPNSERNFDVDSDIAPPASNGNNTSSENSLEEMSVNTIASKLDVKTGSDLLMAGCAYLYFISEKREFTKNEIREAMKSANEFYNQNMSSNYGKYFTALIKSKRLNEKKPGVYTLPRPVIDELRQKLA